jgi:hypothetical protein
MTTTDLAAMHRAVRELRQCLAALADRYGDSASVRRVANDVDRLDIDLAELDAVPLTGRAGGLPSENLVLVSDEPYDPSLWHGADDEGVGGHRRHP